MNHRTDKSFKNYETIHRDQVVELQREVAKLTRLIASQDEDIKMYTGILASINAEKKEEFDVDQLKKDNDKLKNCLQHHLNVMKKSGTTEGCLWKMTNELLG